MVDHKDRDVLEKRRSEDFSAELAQTGWYHSIELPGGRLLKGFLTLEELRERWAQLPLPADLTGKRLLDIGTWDGWFSFEAERRGAQVVAVDNVEQDTFRFAHRMRQSQVAYENIEVYELRDRDLEPFDYVLFLGVLYHLRHPLLALDIVCELTRDLAIVDSFTVDDDPRGAGRSPIPWMEFYETNELSNQIDNWTGPTVECLLAMCRSAGFARVEYLGTKHRHARVACYRHWEPEPADPSVGPPHLRGLISGRAGDPGINFMSRREEFVTCWFRAEDKDLRREDLRPEVSGYGVSALVLKPDGENYWSTSFRLPPGLGRGWHEVRLRTVNSGFSNSVRIAVDLPAKSDSIVILSVCDGVTWRTGETSAGEGEGNAYVTFWIAGLGENCDRNNVRVSCEGHRLPVEFVSEPSEAGARQVNARLPPFALREIGSGRRRLHVAFGGAVAEIDIEILAPE